MNESNLRLTDVYANPDESAFILWDLLKERKPEQSISHKGMPTLRQHLDFIESRPYQAWFIIWKKKDAITEIPAGAIYLTKANEIGIAVFQSCQKQGIGPTAIQMLLALPINGTKHVLANINPQNSNSIRMFEKLGFKHIQNTYEKE